MNARRYSFSLHLIAMLVVLATFPLIFMGGLVTSHQAGMSVPDWPNSYGYNMFLFPPRLWVGGILFEHTHRLAATVVGMLSIILTITAWISENPRWVKWLATSVLGAVIFQGVLGGLRVVFVQLDLAIVHACVAQAFFCLAAFMAVISSRWWTETKSRPMSVASRQLVALAFVCMAAIYGQLILGACMRHFKAGLAIPDFPLSYGHVLPPSNLQAINDYRVMKLNLDPVTSWQIWLHFSHRCGALVVTVLLLALIGHVIYHNRRDRKLLWPAVCLLCLLAGQITLGILTVLLRKPADIASAHVAVGALILMTTFVLAVRARHLYSLPIVDSEAEGVSAADFEGIAGMSSSPSIEFAASVEEVPSHWADLYELTKPRMNMLVVITTMVGAYMGSREAVPWVTVLNVCIGTALTASSAAVLNQFLERGFDALMLRTRNRPLPAGRINLLEALLFGLVLGITGLIYLAIFVNPLTFFIAAITLLSYLLIYTPMKRVSSLNTLVGGVPGALPAVMGFTAVQNHLSVEAWLVFLIMFVWQMPHFLAIATMYKDDYARGGFKMLPGVDPKLSGQQMLLYTMALIPISIAPCVVRMSGLVYFFAAIFLGLAFLYYAVPVARDGGRPEARKLFFASIIYLPILFSILMIDKI